MTCKEIPKDNLINSLKANIMIEALVDTILPGIMYVAVWEFGKKYYKVWKAKKAAKK